MEEGRPAKRGLKVNGSALRCPYCHESIVAAGWVSCASCLARHHGACWRETRECSSCGHEESLAKRRREPPRAPQALEPTKNPGVAAALSFLYMGLGQIYCGHLFRGISIAIGLPICMAIFVLAGTMAQLYVLYALPLVAWIWQIVDAYECAQVSPAARRRR